MSDYAPPAEHRVHARFWILLFGCAAAPIFWLGQLMLGYWISAEICFGSDHPTTTTMPGMLRASLYAFDIIAIVATLAGGTVSFLCWRAMREGGPGGLLHPPHRGEERARFMAIWGIFSSLCFLIAVIFETIASVTVPICAR